MSIDQMIDALIGREGGFSDHPSDPGKRTRWGVTETVARQHGYTGDMRLLPRDFAVNVYRKTYFAAPGFDKVYALSQRVAEEMFDTGVNMGVSIPGPWLQRSLNVLNRQQADYKDIAVDGAIGPATIAALRAYLNKRGTDGEKVLLRLLNSFQGVRYVEICEKREASEDFAHGWALNRLEIA